MKNYHTIDIKYYGATNTKGSRVKLTSKRFNQSVFIPFDYARNTIEEMATDYLEKNGQKVVGVGSDCIICDAIDNRFKSLKD